MMLFFQEMPTNEWDEKKVPKTKICKQSQSGSIPSQFFRVYTINPPHTHTFLCLQVEAMLAQAFIYYSLFEQAQNHLY